MPLLEIIRVAIVLLGTGAAAYQDAKTSFIDEKTTYAMIAAGALLNLASLNFSSFPNSIDWNFLQGSFGIAAVIFAVGFLLYKQGQIGGGDVLLFTGIHLLLPFRLIDFGLPLINFAAPQLSIAQAIAFQRALSSLPPVVSIFAAASFFALVGSAFLYASSLAGKKLKPELLMGSITGAAGLAFTAWIYSTTRDAALTVFFAALAASAAFLSAFKKQILEEVIVKQLALNEVEEEDILVTSMMDQKLVQKYGIGRVLTKQEVEKLKEVSKKEGIARFPVAKVLPRLGPYILLALLSTLLLGDLFAFLIILK